MALLQQALSPTIHKIYEQREETQSHLFLESIPLSMVGDECIKSIWYDYRFCDEFAKDGISLRTDEIDKVKIAQVVKDLSSIGCVISEIDKRTGKKWTASTMSGHIASELHGVIESGVIEAPKAAHVLKVSCITGKQFAQVKTAGTEKAAPFIFAEVQAQMYLMDIERCFCVFVNNDNNELFSERIKLDKDGAKFLIDRVGSIVCSDLPPVGISDNEKGKACKSCRFADVCHKGYMVKPTCRNCVHATCERETGGWSCSKWNCQIPIEGQVKGCGSHLYNPAFMKDWTVKDANDQEQWVRYEKEDKELTNAVDKKNGYTSNHLYSCPPEMIDDANIFELMSKFDAELVE